MGCLSGLPTAVSSTDPHRLNSWHCTCTALQCHMRASLHTNYCALNSSHFDAQVLGNSNIASSPSQRRRYGSARHAQGSGPAKQRGEAAHTLARLRGALPCVPPSGVSRRAPVDARLESRWRRNLGGPRHTLRCGAALWATPAASCATPAASGTAKTPFAVPTDAAWGDAGSAPVLSRMWVELPPGVALFGGSRSNKLLF